MSDLELVRKVGYVNPELEKILEVSPEGPSILTDDTDWAALRETICQRRLANPTPLPPAHQSITETDFQVPTRDGSHITVRVYRHQTSKDGSESRGGGGPVLVMLHGGGFALGSLDNEAQLCREWVVHLHGVSINVAYRLAPEHTFPVPIYDGCDAIRWVSANPGLHGGDLTKGFIVAGHSAGATTACTAAHLARDEGMKPAITGVCLMVPAVLSPEVVPERWKAEYTSREDNKNAIVLDAEEIRIFRKTHKDDPQSKLTSPALYSHENIPPTYLQVAGWDPLRDDGLVYEKILREEGIPTRLDAYPGLPHGFWACWPKAEFSKKHARDTIEGFRWLLSRPNATSS